MHQAASSHDRSRSRSRSRSPDRHRRKDRDSSGSWHVSGEKEKEKKQKKRKEREDKRKQENASTRAAKPTNGHKDGGNAKERQELRRIKQKGGYTNVIPGTKGELTRVPLYRHPVLTKSAKGTGLVPNNTNPPPPPSRISRNR